MKITEAACAEIHVVCVFRGVDVAKILEWSLCTVTVCTQVGILTASESPMLKELRLTFHQNDIDLF